MCVTVDVGAVVSDEEDDARTWSWEDGLFSSRDRRASTIRGHPTRAAHAPFEADCRQQTRGLYPTRDPISILPSFSSI